ncbi:hypothetical protein BJY00DRAFT_59253 [Aspergillus carlsbadensis]|nr:hypothetical protein BJY00DRAFT_59253 [Aspergillus carlsbadensis]
MMVISWKQVSATRWERPLTGMEDYLVETGRASIELCNGRQQYNIFSKVRVEIDVPDVEYALRQAWKQLRYKQPAIAATLDGDRKVYESPNEAGLEEWMKSTFIVSDVRDTDTLVSKPIHQATLYYLPNTSEIVLRAHHWVIDGIGTIMFWHCFMQALASPNPNLPFGDEQVRLSAPHDEVLGYTGSPTPKQSSDTTAMITGYLQSLPGIGLPSEIGKAPAAACHNQERIFSKEITAEIIAACKEKNISVTSAVQAAYVCMLVKHADPASNRTRYTTANEFDTRPYLPSPHSTASFAVGVYYVPMPFTVDLPASYMDIAQALHKHYQTSLKGSPETVKLTPHYCHIIAALSKTEQFKSAPPATDGFVSSLGVVENHLHHQYGETVTVSDFKIGLDVVLGTSAFLFYTFDGRLRMAYSFNDGYERLEKVKEYLEDVERILREELLGMTA